MKDKLIEMFQLQEDLNRRINENWREIRSHEDFARATWIECAELVDSLPWKWWKKQEADLNNVKIEIIDIWHFIMSYILLDYPDIGEAIESEEIQYFLKALKEDFHNINIDGQYINHYLGETDYYKKLIFLTERVAEGFLKQNIKEGIFFFGLLVKNTLSFDELYLLYIGKNILNHIRQEKGYNEGQYKKIFDGIEDNYYLFQIVKNVNSRENLEKEIRKTFDILNT
ncbi:MAG: dUTPase [Aquificae bacterium]|nr:dUTPase [Aquificota bacterium]